MSDLSNLFAAQERVRRWTAERENLDALCNSGLGFVVVGHNTEVKPSHEVASA